jgi:hypothetical protein
MENIVYVPNIKIVLYLQQNEELLQEIKATQSQLFCEKNPKKCREMSYGEVNSKGEESTDNRCWYRHAPYKQGTDRNISS